MRTVSDVLMNRRVGSIDEDCCGVAYAITSEVAIPALEQDLRSHSDLESNAVQDSMRKEAPVTSPTPQKGLFSFFGTSAGRPRCPKIYLRSIQRD